MIKKLATVLFFTLITLAAHAQDAAGEVPQMADAFRAEGKIYVVVTVMSIVFMSLVCFLVYLERRVKKLEKRIGEKN